MLPGGHIEYTWATLNLIQRKTGLFGDADYRWIAVAASLPDLIDKPLALTAYRSTDAALFWGHNLWFHLGAWIAVAAWCARPDSDVKTNARRAMPYVLAFSGHLIADRMWGFQETLLYPLGAGHWHPWVHVGEPGAMLQAYIDIVRSTPILVFFEASGLALLAWFVMDRRLWRPRPLLNFLRTGRFGASNGTANRRLILGRQARTAPDEA
jgi:hypothetical protein